MPRKTIADLEEARLEVVGSPRPHDPNRVMPVQCATCPYLPDDQGLELNDETMIAMKTDPTIGNQYCHSPAWLGKPEDVICRGHRDHWIKFFYHWKLLPAATDQAWADLLLERTND